MSTWNFFSRYCLDSCILITGCERLSVVSKICNRKKRSLYKNFYESRSSNLWRILKTRPIIFWTVLRQFKSFDHSKAATKEFAVVNFSWKESGKMGHLGGGFGLPKVGEEHFCDLQHQAQLDVPSFLPQKPKREKVERAKKWRAKGLLRGLF